MGYASTSDIPYAIVEERTFIRRVYAWMTGGLVVTALIALITAATPAIQRPIITSRALFFGLIIGELALVGYLSFAIAKMSPFTAAVCFIMYSALNGLTLSIIFVMYTIGSIGTVFCITAGTFGAMTAYGYVTKRDLTSIGSLCGMAVFGLILAMIVNMVFVRSGGFDLIISIVGVLVFVGLTAYDSQKIKQIHAKGRDGTDADKKLAVMGALRLYLDFINMFLFMLRLMGRRR